MTKIFVIIIFIIGWNVPFWAQEMQLRLADKKEIQQQAINLVKEYELLLNSITNKDYLRIETDEIITNACNPGNPRSIFENCSITIEDDVNPNTIKELKKYYDLDFYLNNIRLVFEKTEEYAVSFSNIRPGLLFEKEGIFIHIGFTSTFNSQHQAVGSKFKAVERVATIKAKKVENRWKSRIFQIVSDTLMIGDCDFDNVPDNLDACYCEPGLPIFSGCPDVDQDSIPDHKDKCPQEAGLFIFQGCPDTDLDSVPDYLDSCKTIAGLVNNNGCPPLPPPPPRCSLNNWVIKDFSLSGKAGNDLAHHVFFNTENQVVLVGEATVKKRKKQGTFQIINPESLAIILDLQFGGTEKECLFKGIEANNGKYYLAGYSESKKEQGREGYLVIIERNGTFKEIFFGSFGQDGFLDIMQHPIQATILLTGYKNQKLWVLEIDYQGNILNEWAYQDENYQGISIEGNTGKNIFILGFQESKKSAKIFKIGNSANLAPILDLKDSKVNDLIVNEKSEVVIAGYHSKSNEIPNSFILKINQNGKEIWNKSIRGDGIDVATCLLELPDEKYLVGGFSTSYTALAAKEKLAVYFLNKNGQFLNQYKPFYFGGKQSDGAHSIAFNSNCQIALAGYTNSNFKGKKAANKTDALLLLMELN